MEEALFACIATTTCWSNHLPDKVCRVVLAHDGASKTVASIARGGETVEGKLVAVVVSYTCCSTKMVHESTTSGNQAAAKKRSFLPVRETRVQWDRVDKAGGAARAGLRPEKTWIECLQ